MTKIQNLSEGKTYRMISPNTGSTYIALANGTDKVTFIVVEKQKWGDIGVFSGARDWTEASPEEEAIDTALKEHGKWWFDTGTGKDSVDFKYPLKFEAKEINYD